MAESRKIDADRLFEAAEAVFQAVVIAGPRSSSLKLPALAEFSSQEVAEAAEFLVRLGYIEGVPPASP